MPRKPDGYFVERIIDALAHNGPMTATQIAREKNMCRVTTSVALCRMHRAPKRVYIADYTYTDLEGGKVHLRPLYALGDKHDAIRPSGHAPVDRPRTPTPNSVFALGVLSRT